MRKITIIMLGQVVLIVLMLIWSAIIETIIGSAEFNETFKIPVITLFGVLCTSASITGLYLFIKEKQ